MAQKQHERQRMETLDYIQAMLGQLSTMAKAEGCNMLTYLIEMAYVEATDIIRGERPARLGPDIASGLAHEQGDRSP